MQISPSAALLHVLSSLPAQAGATQPAKPPASAAQPPALVAAAKALAGRQVTAQAATTVPTLPPGDGTAPKNLPRGSVVNLVV
jgi:hypothetical protein